MMISSKLIDEDEVTRWIPPSISPTTTYEKSGALPAEYDKGRDMVEVERDIDAEIEKAKQDGYQEGLLEGEARGKAIASNERSELQQLLSSFQSRITRIDESTQQALIDFAFKLGRTIIQRELRADKQYYLSLIHTVVEEIGKDAPPLSIKLHPDDVDLLSQAGSREDSDVLTLLVKDESLQRGSCLIETAISFIDAGLDSMIDRIAADFDKTACQADAHQ